MKKIKLDCALAYTLTEIMVVVIILGVIASIALPRFGRSMDNIRNEEAQNVLTIIYQAQKSYFHDFGTYATTLAQLDVEFGTIKNFTGLTVNNQTTSPSCGGSTLPFYAKLDSADGSYSLYATDEGVICAPCTGTACIKLGFPTY
ncbi:MAG: type II secretion system protein [Candidatus Omnitrophica bacterium]|nr:type II secretion system protein [Candidatus Omnitrophota bacterium]